jgi:RIO-like serine/threonine protein kinase
LCHNVAMQKLKLTELAKARIDAPMKSQLDAIGTALGMRKESDVFRAAIDEFIARHQRLLLPRRRVPYYAAH